MAAADLILSNSTLVGNSPAVQSFMDRLPTPAIAPRETLIGKVIDGFNAQSILVDFLCLFAAADLSTSTSSLFGNGTSVYVGGADISGVSRFTADRGYTPAGSSVYLETGFNPSTATYFSRNSGAFFAWLLNGSLTGGTFGNSLGTGISITLDFGGSHLKWKLNDGSVTNGDDAGAIAYADGLYVLNRTGASAKTLDFNGTQIDGKTTASEAIPNATIQCAVNNVVTVAAIGFCGALSSGQRTALYSSILQPYMHAIGAV